MIIQENSIVGLVIGKFFPLHKGHMALIQFAKINCDKLIVLVCATKQDAIPGPVRFNWLKSSFAGEEQIHIDYTDDDLPDAPVSSRTVSTVWARYLKARYPAVSLIFSSEKYGDYLAEDMGSKHIPFDFNRMVIPVSGTVIRQNPWLAWDYLVEAAKVYYQKKICLYGPESTGKSTLTKQLAEHYAVSYVPEMARELLGDRHVVFEDIARIAALQAETLSNIIKKLDKFVFCDTDLLTTIIYARYYFGKIPAFPEWIEQIHRYDFYLFCEIDTPWLPDPQRDLGHKRQEMRELFLNELEQRNIPYALITGNGDKRFERACTIIDEWLENPSLTGT
jgi:HTH-type transcriptional repressor of NAD biosynthesis genes